MKTKLILIGVAVLLVVASIILVSYFVRKNNDVPTVTNIDFSNVQPALDPETKEFTIKAGVNLPGLEGTAGTRRYKEAEKRLTDKSIYSDIKNQGFDHVRIPIDFRNCYSAETNTLNEDLIKTYDKVLDLAEAAGLYAIVDFHGWYKIEPHYVTDKEKFLNIWKLVAERYADRSNYVIFELLNEPENATARPGGLNRMQKEAIEIIRESNPERLIICATTDKSQPWMISSISLPENDDNVAVSIHIYNPGRFTHQGYEWANQEKNKQVRLSDEMYDELMWDINEIKKFIDSTGTPVIVSEFGMNVEISAEEDRATYLGTIVEFCDEYNIPWTFWRYDGWEMSLYDDGKWKTDLLDILFMRK